MAESHNETIDIESLYETHTTKEQIKESFDRMTVPTGRYKFVATKVETVQGGEDHPVPGLQKRPYVKVFGKLVGPDPVTGEEKRKGSVGFDASWEVRRTDNGKMDRFAKLWGQVVTALGIPDASIGETVNALKSYPVELYVTEGFKDPAEGWRTIRDEEKRKEVRKAGYDTRNFVDSVSKAR